MRERATVVVGLCLLWACAGPSGPERVTSSAASVSGQTISVVEFDQSGADVRYNAPHDAFGLTVAEEIAGALRKRGYDAEAIPAGGAPTGEIVVTGRITRIDGGSRAQRYWVGFGAGAAKFAVAGDVRRADRIEVASFSHERWSGFGVFGGSSVSLMQKCIRAVGADVAKMIDTGQYSRVEE